jgi:hypothetical protein
MMMLCVIGLIASAQIQNEDATRHLWDTAYIKKGGASRKTSAKRSYRIATPRVSVEGVSASTVIGVTIWRLRPARSAEKGERIVVHEEAGATEWLPERVSSDAKLREGDRIRLSIEAARTGYLYVIAREQYVGGTAGEPFLIFPTKRTRGGDNAVKSGRVIEVPAQDDNPPFFTLKRTRSDHTGETLIVLVTPTPIEGLQIGDHAQRLLEDQVAMWEKRWGAEVGRLEMENSAGKRWTKEEKEAGANSTRSLNEEEPAPQTLYYRPGAKTADPVLVKVELQYARPGARGGKRQR